MGARRADLKLYLSSDGDACIELRTLQPLPNYEPHGRPVVAPAEYLHWDNRVGFEFAGSPSRYVTVWASDFEHQLASSPVDLSEGSDERAVIQRIVDCGYGLARWVNEEVEVRYVPRQIYREALAEALEQTRGVSREAWKREGASWQRRSMPPGRSGAGKRHRRRSASRPKDVVLPFFAQRSGALPRAQGGEVEGVRLPVGERQPRGAAAFWVSREPVGNIEMLAPWLASQFSGSGVWPLLWRTEEDPEEYFGPDEDIDEVDSVDLLEVMRARWVESPPHQEGAPGAFPGLAAGVAGGVLENPFPDWALSEPTRLLLVPCNRPADAITAVGGVAGDTPPPAISAVLRSWEERFGAVVYEVRPAFTRLSVARRPNDPEQALALATEISACLTDRADLKTRDLSMIAHDLQYDEREQTLNAVDVAIAADAWDITW